MKTLKRITGLALGLIGLTFGASVAQAWYVSGQVICDVNLTGQTEAEDTPKTGVGIIVRNTSGTFTAATTTGGANGTYLIMLPEVDDTYTVTVDLSTLPAGSRVLLPESGQHTFAINDATPGFEQGNFLVDACRPAPPPPPEEEEEEEDCGCGKLTGGGWIDGTPSREKGTFAVSGGIRRGEFWGKLNYTDHKTGMHVKSTAVTHFAQDPASVNGRVMRYNVTIDGQPGTASVRAVDNGEPGRNDIFEIRLSTGYSAGGDLGGARKGGGNIQLHKCPPGWANECGCEEPAPAPAQDKGGKKK